MKSKFKEQLENIKPLLAGFMGVGISSTATKLQQYAIVQEDMIADIKYCTGCTRIEIIEFCQTTRYSIKDVYCFAVEIGHFPTINDLRFVDQYGIMYYKYVKKVKGREFFVDYY